MAHARTGGVFLERCGGHDGLDEPQDGRGLPLEVRDLPRTARDAERLRAGGRSGRGEDAAATSGDFPRA